jgi:hypothetical protein
MLKRQGGFVEQSEATKNQPGRIIMEAITTGASWWAVGISTVLCFMLGGCWYSPILFGTKWAEGVGVETVPEAKQPEGGLVTQLAGTFLLAWLLGLADAINTYPAAALIVLTITTLLIAANPFAENTLYSSLVQGLFVVAMVFVMVACNLLI